MRDARRPPAGAAGSHGGAGPSLTVLPGGASPPTGGLVRTHAVDWDAPSPLDELYVELGQAKAHAIQQRDAICEEALAADARDLDVMRRLGRRVTVQLDWQEKAEALAREVLEAERQTPQPRVATEPALTVVEAPPPPPPVVDRRFLQRLRSRAMQRGFKIHRHPTPGRYVIRDAFDRLEAAGDDGLGLDLDAVEVALDDLLYPPRRNEG